MRYYFIINPGSRDGRSQEIFQEVFQILDGNGVNYAFQMTKKLKDAYEYSRYANRAGYDVIVAMGGDGTINQVVNGFYDGRGIRISKQSRLGVLYTGTSPDICKAYNIPFRNAKLSMDTLIRAHVRRIEVGKIILATTPMIEYDGKPIASTADFKTRYFIGSANVGFGATLARYANSGIRKYFGDVAGTFISLIRVLASYKSCDQKFRFDGHEETVSRLLNMTFGKICYIASGIKMKNNLKDGDGRFYRLTLRDLSLKHVPGVFKKVYSGDIKENTGQLSLGYSKVIDVYGNTINPEVEYDGDPQGYLPCRIEVAREKLDIITGGIP